MTRPLREALIRPQAISHNVETLRGLTSAEHTLVVVKANGYGHGDVTAARAALAGGADWLGTADIPEALALRQAGITTPILAWMYGPVDYVAEAYAAGIDLGVSSLKQLESVRSVASKGQPFSIHLKLDSGLGRSGADRREWDALFQATLAAQNAGLITLVGLFTHLSGTSREADADQGEVFHEGMMRARALGLDPLINHVSASLGASESPALAHDMVRLGVSAYGIPLTPQHEAAGLRPAMRVAAQIILVKTVSEGTGVGYGHTYRTQSETTLALVPLGYADGVPRSASNKGPVSINGSRFIVSGRISMDQFSVDVGNTPVSEGDWAVLWGDSAEGDPTAVEWADAADTIAYEIITRLGNRVVRVVEE